MHVSIIDLANFIMELGPYPEYINERIAERFPHAEAGTICVAIDAAENKWHKLLEMKQRNPRNQLIKLRRKPAPFR
jgi:hypothetical protein